MVERRRLFGVGDVIYILVIVFLIVVGFGRVLGFPVSLMVVSGSSMSPTLETFDMVVAVRKTPSNGDIVVWCTSATFCVVHRLVNISGSNMVTKGDANPAPDPPVSIDRFVGTVVLVIPRYVWIPVMLAPLVAQIARLLARRSTMIIAARGISAIVSVVLVFMFYVTVFSFLNPLSSVLFLNLKIPTAELASATLMPDRPTVAVNISVDDMEIIGVSRCTIEILDQRLACDPRVNGTTIYIDIPPHLLDIMNIKGVNMFKVGLTLKMSKNATIETYMYPVYLVVSKPVITINGSRVSIYNPNVFCLSSNIAIQWANGTGVWNITKLPISCIDPLGRVEIDFSSYRFAFLRFEYVLMGSPILEQKEVMRDGVPVNPT